MPTTPKLQPALFGGLFIGVLSGLPVVGWLNTCCCLWVVIGGALAVWLSQKNHPYPLTAADGALIGLLAGLIGGLVAMPINAVFDPMQRQLALRLLAMSQAEVPPQIQEMLEQGSRSTFGTIVNGVFMTVVYMVFSMFGGLLGVAMFKKKDLPPPPPGTVEILPPA